MSRRRVLYTAVIVALALTAGILVSNQDSQATTFRPLVGPIILSDETLGANADIRIPFQIQTPDANFGAYVVTLNSPQFVSSAVTPGKTVGYLMANATLGLLNQGCLIQKTVNFQLIAASTDNSAGNAVSPTGPLSSPVQSFTEDDGDINNDKTTFLGAPHSAGVSQLTVSSSAGFVATENVYIGAFGSANQEIKTIAGIPDATHINLTSALANDHSILETVVTPDDTARAGNGIPDGAEWYPEFLNTLFSGQAPSHRYFGWQTVPGTGGARVIVQITLFEPGDFHNLPAMPSSDLLTAAQGAPSAVILNDPTVVPPQAIEDFCTPLVTSTTLCGKTDNAPDNPQLVTPDCDVGLTAESGAQCDNAVDDDGDNKVNDGCPAVGPAESAGTQCNNATDDDDDGKVNDGCLVDIAESDTGQCDNSLDDDVDGKVNDGCPAVGPAESGVQCDNKVDDDSDGKVNDGCPATASPEVRGTNPTSAGTYDLRTFNLSQRDADNDGIENWLDPCPLSGNPDNWNPRATVAANKAAGADNDGDNIPNVCDPQFDVAGEADFMDQDVDGWFNRVDNCPLVFNASPTMTTRNQEQLDFDVQGGPVPDGGPPVDFIGPECDPNPTVPDGHYHSALTIDRMCLGGADADVDDVCDVDDPIDTQAECDAAPPCTNPSDSDNDGVPDADDNCIGYSNANPAGLTQMTPDLNGNGVVQIDDVAYVAARFGKGTGQDGYRAAAELASQNGTIQIDDVTAVAGAFGANC